MNDLQALTSLATELLTEYGKVEQLEKDLKAAKERVRALEEERIPAVMDEVGMETFTTADGFKLTVGDKIRCGELKRQEGLDWLRANGHAGLIRCEVVVPFGVGQDEKARELVQDLAGKELAARQEAKVLWNSLASTIGELMEKGEDVPLELLGAYIQRTTKVEAPKAKKPKNA
jgi:hypothetical protein